MDNIPEDGTIMEPPTRSRHISDPSITYLNMSKTVKEADLCQPFERTQSDAALIKEQMNRHVFKGSASLDNYDGNDSHLLKADANNQISLRSKVYMDLSCMADREEKEESRDRKLSARRSQVLEPIPQDDSEDHDEDDTDFRMCLNFCAKNRPLLENDTDNSSTGPPSPDEDDAPTGSFCSKYPFRFPHGFNQIKHRHNLKLTYQTLSTKLEGFINQLKVATQGVGIQCAILNHILNVIREAWDTPVYGRDIAYGLCDIVRLEGLLDMLVNNCVDATDDLLVTSVDLLEQVMSIKNRERVAKIGLVTVVQMTRNALGNCKLARATTGILENLFKLSEETCTRVINLGGLDVILHWCRCSNVDVLRRCAKALANLSLFGGCENQEVMAKRKVPEWLFPLAFSDDNSVRYYACLAVSALVANKELQAPVIKSGTLDLVLPFISSNKPSEFAQNDISHKQGRDKNWLERLIPLLFSRRQEAQALAAFHFAMESSIKAEQGRQEIFYEINAVEPLKKLASSPNDVASKLAAEALKTIGEKIPHTLSQQVPLWTVPDVVYWVSQVGFAEYCSQFEIAQVDGDLLLILTDEDLQDGLGMKCSIVRKRFLRELKSLKITADYSACDTTGLDNWLMGLFPDLSQYTYNMLRQGVDKYMLHCLSEEELRNECGITNSIHRRKIIQHMDEIVEQTCDMTSFGPLPVSDLSASLGNGMRCIDVFLCYRRSSGSQLASLLKVHLQLRGFTVFLDIDRLRAGKFDENLLHSIQLSRNFIIILTHDAVDRCVGDIHTEDWVHKEIVTALASNTNIVPIMDNFEWPPLEKLPQDMHNLVRFNSVRWVHDYQDACVDKLEAFLIGGSQKVKQNRQISHTGSASGLSSPSQEDLLRSMEVRKVGSSSSLHSNLHH
ncbi:NAD(+) hydrolase sarm1-like [Gigantopelta aegis]|uniref:NAD(+) hydrolase sarm1-like n=1 Tax=Gigantopelta aegis TaxID=1735272 RepID=UPI001B88D58E|nr:NAD(+) hydrolase sarm1-like [Gigantopelta aegis]XP_041379037.1 NAD(+) hydrolase sarm1-like [Gigantopelta aegis]